MKTILFLLLFISNFVYSQITIRNESLVEKPYYKPKSFDSLSNIQQQKRFIDYKQYLGYKVYLKPKSTKFTPSQSDKNFIDYLTTDKETSLKKPGKIPFNDIIIYKAFNGGKGLSGAAKDQYERALKQYEDLDKLNTNIYLPEFTSVKTDPTDGVIYGYAATKPSAVESKYFTILEIEGRDKYSQDKKFKKLEDLPSDLSLQTAELRIKLKKDQTNDTLYWNVNEARNFGDYPFILVPYFEKAKKDFVGQNLVATKSISNLVNSKTGDIVNIEQNQKWFCEDLSLTDTNKTKYLKPLYYLANQNNTIVLDIDQLRSSFITEAQYDKIQEEKKLAEAEKIKQQKADEQKRIEEDKKSRQLYINTYGAKIGNLIADNKVAIGMNMEMCRIAWGEPLDINRITMKGYAHEQWVYGFGTYLYFNNGILSTIQN